ncbi:MAG: hypothetical protein U9Q81_05585 [Pseudomonadota bacterium]|nr:hypothetical protein [Pseudomonadota bacterium]
MGSHQEYWHYAGYTVVNILFSREACDRERVIDLWTRNRILPKGVSASERAKQAVLMALDSSGQAVAVNTVYPARLRPDGALLFFYRMFVQPGDRVYGLMRFMTVRAWDVLSQTPMENKPAGVAIVTENRKLQRRGMVAMFEAEGWERVGGDAQGRDVWRKLFIPEKSRDHPGFF